MRGRDFFDAVADALTSFLPPSLRDFGVYRTSYNIKLWYGDEQREHYEIQAIRRKGKLCLEIGFHAEHKDKTANDETLTKLTAHEKQWRRTLGKDAEAGAFIGQQTAWRRLSEVWTPGGSRDGDDPEIAIDAAERLATYIQTLEPLRTTATARRSTARRSGSGKTR